MPRHESADYLPPQHAEEAKGDADHARGVQGGQARGIQGGQAAAEEKPKRDPVQAEASFGRAIKAMSAHDNAVIFRAEAIRRMGFPEDAKEIAFRRTLRNSPFLIPVRARILADLDDLQGAREALESSPSPNEIESLASRWYVARVAGEPTQELQDSWNLLNRSAGARLEALIPLE